MAMEVFSFDKGMNRKKETLLLDVGEVYTATGFSFEKDGVLEARLPKTIGLAIDADTTSYVNGIHRYSDDIYASSKARCYGTDAVFTAAAITQPTFNYIYYRDIAGTSFSNIDLSSSNTRPRWCDFEDFTFIVDGELKKAYYKGSKYDWGSEGPPVAPTVAVGAGGANPSGTYDCYYTWHVKFPNGKEFETAPSPAASITVVTQKITWSNIRPCPYEGSELILTRRLYRTVSGTAYLLKILADNVTTTYSDDVTDAALQAASILETESYITPPDNAVDVVMYLQRIFFIKGSRLYWTEAYMPFICLDTSDVVVTKDNEPLVALVDWGDQLYFPSASRWYRLQGTDPDTWAIKRTFADNGIINRDTLKRTKYGLIGLWYDGIYNFDGVMTRNLTEKKLGREFFTDLPDLSLSYAEFDGSRYYFYYSSDGSTIDKCIIIDFSLSPEYRILEDNFVAEAHEYYKEAGVNYYAKDGYEYADSGTETIVTSIVTGDKVFGAITKRKCLRYLYYDCNTNSKDLTVSILADGTSVDSLTINNSSRERNRSRPLKTKEGYRMSLELSCSDSQSLKIYAPWILEADLVGE